MLNNFILSPHSTAHLYIELDSAVSLVTATNWVGPAAIREIFFLGPKFKIILGPAQASV